MARYVVNRKMGQFPTGRKRFYNSHPQFPTGRKCAARPASEAAKTSCIASATGYQVRLGRIHKKQCMRHPRYADDFVVLAQQQTPRLVGWIETKLESWMGLEINREKTRIIKLRQQGASLDFLGFTFRYDRARPEWGQHRYLNVIPSKKALARERTKLREMTNAQQNGIPIPQLLGELNRNLRGWGNYFRFGYPRHAFNQINSYVQWRLWKHLRRRSQRPYRPPKGMTGYAQMKQLGLLAL